MTRSVHTSTRPPQDGVLNALDARTTLHTWSILLVEDDPHLQDLLSVHLRALRYQVQVCRTISEARRCLNHTPPDAVLLDLHLPDGNGLALLDGLQQNLSVLVLTGQGSPQDRVQALNRGADDCLVKPFLLDELDARLKLMLRRPKLAGRMVYASGTTLDLDLLRISTASGYVQVTEQEARLLEVLMKHLSRVVTLERLEHHVYGHFVPASNGVLVRLSSLRRKLRQVSSALHIRALRGEGYALFYEAS